MKVVTEILQDLEILKRLLKHNANLKIRINYYLTSSGTFLVPTRPGFRTLFSWTHCEEQGGTGTVQEQIVIEDIVN